MKSFKEMLIDAGCAGFNFIENTKWRDLLEDYKYYFYGVLFLILAGGFYLIYAICTGMLWSLLPQHS